MRRFSYIAILLSFLLAPVLLLAQSHVNDHLSLVALSQNKTNELEKFPPGDWVEYAEGTLRKITGDDSVAFLGFHPTVLITESPQPFAFVTKEGQINLSSGMLGQVQTSSQLAFLLAHEIGHVLLKHHDHDHHTTQEEFLLHELAADKIALELIASAGFDTLGGARLLRTISGFGKESGISYNRLFPGIEARLTALSPVDNSSILG